MKYHLNMKRITLILASLLALAIQPADARKQPKTQSKAHSVVAVPAIEKTLVTVETDHSQLVLVTDRKGTLYNYHYGAKLSAPEDFLRYETRINAGYGTGPMAYPTQGGAYVNEPALAVKYADSYRNTELRYLSHTQRAKGNVVTTEILLKDYVTELEVRLFYDAYQKEDVILSHAEIVNGGKQPVTLVNYASSAMVFDAEKYLLTHMYGDWAAEMQVDRELLTHDMKVIETKRGTQATQWNNPSFLLSLNTESFSETEGEVIAGSLAWSGNFRLSFEKDVTHRLTVLAGINPFSSDYPLAAITASMAETRSTPRC